MADGVSATVHLDLRNSLLRPLSSESKGIFILPSAISVQRKSKKKEMKKGEMHQWTNGGPWFV